MTVDDIVKICIEFYRDNEITEAQSLLEKCGIIIHKRRGPEKNRSTVKDTTKVV